MGRAEGGVRGAGNPTMRPRSQRPARTLEAPRPACFRICARDRGLLSSLKTRASISVSSTKGLGDFKKHKPPSLTSKWGSRK
jgi:hypothetical protein